MQGEEPKTRHIRHFHYLYMNPDKEQFRMYTFTREKLGDNSRKIFEDLQTVWGTTAPGESTIRRWCHEFATGERCSFADKSKPGRPMSTRTAEMISAVGEMISSDPKLSSRDIADELDTSHTSILQILREDLHLRNVCSVWVPHELSAENKQQRVQCANLLRNSLLTAGEARYDVYAVEDETYVNFEPVHTKAENRTWLPVDAPRLRVVRDHLTRKKTLLLVAFTAIPRFSIVALPYGETVTGESMVDFIRQTGDRWRTLRHSPIHLKDLLWQMDNARPHMAQVVKNYLSERQVTTLWQSPYSPDFNLCDRFLFAWLKTDLRKQSYNSHEEVLQAASRIVRSIPEDKLKKAVDELLTHCQEVIDAKGDYITE